MYLTLDQVNHVLGSPHYSVPFTESLINYALYRGHLNSKVYTVRFNIIETVNEDFIFNHLYTQLLSRFPLESRFRASIRYDILLCDPKQVPPSYYIWRANSNHPNYNENNEIVLELSPDHLFQFTENCLNIPIPDLEIDFRNSNVIVAKVLAIVFSFATIPSP
jgi:hypothetical protein